MTAVGGGVLSETSNNNMTAVGGSLDSLFIKNNKEDRENNKLLKLLETTQTSNVSPANINTATMDNKVSKLLGGDFNVTESLTTEAMEQQLRKLLGGKKN